MLRLILTSLLLTACSINTVKKGGNDPYVYSLKQEYTPEQLKELAPKIVTTLKRKPSVGTQKQLFSKEQKGLKRIGIIVFDSMIQNSITGVANEDRLYLSDQGKQLLTEKLLAIWEQTLPIADHDIEYVPVSHIKKSKESKQYGTDTTNYVMVPRTALNPDDVFFLDTGKKISMVVSHNPRGMRDVSFLLVPASELMGGPKWSEHNKHYANDIAKELKLDAVLVIQSTMKWTAARTEKNSGEVIPEEAKVELEVSTLIPLSSYNERLKKIGSPATPNHTLCYRSYEGTVKFPINLTLPPEKQTFDSAMTEVINPVLKAYSDLSYMAISLLTEDLKKTR